MALKGEEKKLYQREYMRRYRAKGLTVRPPQIEPALDPSLLDPDKTAFVTPIPKPTKKKMGRAIWLR